MEFSTADVVKTTVFIAATLFPIVNPLGGAPLFLSLTGQYPSRTQRVLARKIAANSLALLMASLFVGAHVLAFFGISLSAVQVGGGLIVAATGWRLLNQPDRREQDPNQIGERDILSHAFFRTRCR
jgi:multiple antibiotic resistance protein